MQDDGSTIYDIYAYLKARILSGRKRGSSTGKAIRPGGCINMKLFFLFALFLCSCATRVVVVRCDYAVLPVGVAGITAADSADEAWRDSAVCNLRTRAALSGGRL